MFDLYWMNLLWANLIGGGLVSVGIWSYLWLTRDRNLAELAPELELKRYIYLTLWITVYVFAIYFTGSFFAEQDAAWHQTIVRDTVFTPSHVVLFYGTIPLYIAMGGGAFLYAMTRLPLFAKGISLPFVIGVTGPFLILPNLGFNEWAHAFYIMEELFSAPVHWGFVVFGWSVLALGGLLYQIAFRMMDLIREVYGTRDAPI